MKSWQSILIQAGVTALTGALQGLVTHAASKSNPDGTPAEEPWITDEEKKAAVLEIRRQRQAEAASKAAITPDPFEVPKKVTECEN